MAAFGLKENIVLICTSGFCFFAMLPLANNCLDYLVRTNIPGDLQGRAWGLIGFLSQIGYVVAYGTAGLLADGIAKGMKLGVGRGAAAVIILSGVLLGLTAAVLYRIQSVKELETQLPEEPEQSEDKNVTREKVQINCITRQTVLSFWQNSHLIIKPE